MGKREVERHSHGSKGLFLKCPIQMIAGWREEFVSGMWRWNPGGKTVRGLATILSVRQWEPLSACGNENVSKTSTGERERTGLLIECMYTNLRIKPYLYLKVIQKLFQHSRFILFFRLIFLIGWGTCSTLCKRKGVKRTQSDFLKCSYLFSGERERESKTAPTTGSWHSSHTQGGLWTRTRNLPM